MNTVKPNDLLDRRQFLAGSLTVAAAAVVGRAASAPESVASIELPPLPYAQNALEPVISARTMEFHYDKHHRGYVNNLNRLIVNTPYAKMPLEEIICNTAGKPDFIAVFNNAAQIWNHTFYWHSLSPQGGDDMPEPLKDKIIADFGSIDACKAAFAEAAVSQFASGWAWLVADHGCLKVVKTANADTPLTHEGVIPLLTIDVWEHAYYLDYQNRRADYAAEVIKKRLNWSFAAQNLRLLATHTS
jgi:Fe-Mn family superoxide dismutase